jgi:hypothetical protein
MVSFQQVKGVEAGRIKPAGYPDVQWLGSMDAVLHLVESGTDNLSV